jgi:hypothetical protein
MRQSHVFNVARAFPIGQLCERHGTVLLDARKCSHVAVAARTHYDIELREPLDRSQAGGGMFQTTALVTRNRIFVPVPEALAAEFQNAGGPKEYFVRFDVLSIEVERV